MIESNARPRGEKPSAEEIERARQQGRPELPEGMSRNQWKKMQRHEKWELTKAEYRRGKKLQKKAAMKRRRLEGIEKGQEIYHQAKKVKPTAQIETLVRAIFDCEFDDLMNDKEIVLMLNQITRAYSAKRHSPYHISLTISSFNKRLKQRFDLRVQQYPLWKGITFVENETLEEILPTDAEQRSRYVYLTADTDNVIEELQAGYTYIIGGIVDKNRHKRLCVNKAQKLGLAVGKLPIDKYIEMNGRQVLATSHVYELCCKWFEREKDWKRAFNDVLPPRKLKVKETGKPTGGVDGADENEGSESDDEDGRSEFGDEEETGKYEGDGNNDVGKVQESNAEEGKERNAGEGLESVGEEASSSRSSGESQ